MSIDLVTSSGVHLTVNAIARGVLDSFAMQHPAPVPPDKEVTLFGGFKDTIPDTADPDYLAAIAAYALAFAADQLELVCSAVAVHADYTAFEQYGELLALGVIRPNSKRDFLKFVALAEDADVQAVVDALFYLSTTAERGIEEAQGLFNITWSSLDLENVHVPHSPARFARYFEDRQAATFAHYTWGAFCELSGPEQSAIVAHYRSSQRLGYLLEDWASHKK